MNPGNFLQAKTEHHDQIIKSLAGKCIVDVHLPSADEPLDEIVLVLDDGNCVMLSASSDDGSGVIAWGLNVPGSIDV